jgi:aspartate/methionine/tyrosine aminotransferase
MNIVPKVSGLLQEGAFKVLMRARQLEAEGRNIVHLEIGEPDFDTPANVIAAGKKALDEGWTHYGPTPGLMPFRETIANYVGKTRGIPVKPEMVSVVPGGKPIICFTILALVGDGDEVIYPNPGFPMYESMAKFAGGVPVPVPLVEDRGFSFDMNVLKDKLSDKTKLIVLNSPQNPTGGLIPKEDLVALADMVRDRDIMILSDEIYSRICYDGTPFSIASLPGMQEKTIILDGFSKTYAMTGWRLGYGVMPEWVLQGVTQLMGNSNSCTASFTQIAGKEALEGPQDAVDNMVMEFRKRRDAIIAGLNQIPGVSCKLPAGAFYAFPNITGTGFKSKPLATALLEEAGIACLSGTDFGAYGEGYLRFSYANSMENINEALNRFDGYIRKNQ